MEEELKSLNVKHAEVKVIVDTWHDKESEMMSFAEKITAKNAQLLSEYNNIEAKVRLFNFIDNYVNRVVLRDKYCSCNSRCKSKI